MSPFLANTEAEHRSQAKRSAALTSLVAALGITIFKLLTGVFTGSLGMLSEAAHSAIDLIAAAITLITVRASDLPADEEHNYGHGKLENLSAAAEALIMVGSCAWITIEAVRRILHHTHLGCTRAIHDGGLLPFTQSSSRRRPAAFRSARGRCSALRH